MSSAAELRVADAQLSGWLEGLLQTMQAAAAVRAEEAQRAQAEAAARAREQAEEARRQRDTSYL